MIIRNLSKQYRVIREWESDGEIAQYICREEEEQKDCRIARQDLKSVSGDEIRFFMDQIHSQSFTDFLDFFTDAKNLYLVMVHNTGESLSKKLEESCSLKERMEIGKNLLEQMVLLDLPDYFFQAAMDSKLIVVSRSLEVRLEYDLKNLDCFRECTFLQGTEGLADIFRELYREELEIKAFPPMETMIYDLRDGKFQNLLEIYGRFQGIYREWADRKREQLKPESFAFRMWEKIKRAGGFLKNLAAAGILVLAVVYLVLSIRQVGKEPGTADNYYSIGTLKIQESSGPQASAGDQIRDMGEKHHEIWEFIRF